MHRLWGGILVFALLTHPAFGAGPATMVLVAEDALRPGSRSNCYITDHGEYRTVDCPDTGTNSRFFFEGYTPADIASQPITLKVHWQTPAGETTGIDIRWKAWAEARRPPAAPVSGDYNTGYANAVTIQAVTSNGADKRNISPASTGTCIRTNMSATCCTSPACDDNPTRFWLQLEQATGLSGTVQVRALEVHYDSR